MPKKDSLDQFDLIVWANVQKWQLIRAVSDKKLAACLGLKDLSNRKRSHILTTRELGRVCKLLEIEPEKLLER
ncbi:MAG: hypothetical protein IJ642_05105 [Oscillospiraceae bacterium]|nr:hypothetical protein [Oscillospiraceae bacterium]